MASAPSPDPNTDLIPPSNTQDEEIEPEAPEPEPKLPSRKDISLKEFLGKMDDYAPIVSNVPVFYPPLRNTNEFGRSQMQ